MNQEGNQFHPSSWAQIFWAQIFFIFVVLMAFIAAIIKSGVGPSRNWVTWGTKHFARKGE